MAARSTLSNVILTAVAAVPRVAADSGGGTRFLGTAPTAGAGGRDRDGVEQRSGACSFSPEVLMRSTLRQIILALGATVGATAAVAAHAQIREERAVTPVEVRLLIWPKRPGTASGSTMSVTVDGGQSTDINNLDSQMLVSLGRFEPGIHQFRLDHITVYNVDQDGVTSRAPGTGGVCAGQFFVQPFQTYYLLGVNTQDGQSFQCVIQ